MSKSAMIRARVEIRGPNAATRCVMENARTGRDVTAADSMEELFSRLDTDTDSAKKRVRPKKPKARSKR